MKYEGKYKVFDPSRIITYPVTGRNNKVKFKDLVFPDQIDQMEFNISEEVDKRITELAKSIITAKEKGNPVLFFTGGHLVKNGLSLLLGELIKKRCLYHCCR